MRAFLLIFIMTLPCCGRPVQKYYASCNAKATASSTCTDYIANSSVATNTRETIFAEQIKSCATASGSWSSNSCDNENQIASCGKFISVKSDEGKHYFESLHYYKPMSLSEASTSCEAKKQDGFSFIPFYDPRTAYGLP